MRFIRFDSVGGASGDMLLSALVALGAELPAIQRTIRKFLPDGVRFRQEPAGDRGLHGVRVSVHCSTTASQDHWPDAHPHRAAPPPHPHRTTQPPHAPHRSLRDIVTLLKSPALDPASRTLALAVFRRLAAAEGAIHNCPPAKVHFHEVGATDSIADIVGCCLALRQLGVSGISVGPLPCGTGTITCAHGCMPNPAPATLRLLAGLAVCQTDEPFELVTPTAAALLATWCAELPAPPATTQVVATGFGFGQRALCNRPNVLRATLLEGLAAPPVVGADAPDLLVLETNLDDCNPQWIGDLLTQLLAKGALDSWATPVIMKKGRPGTILSALVTADHAATLREQIFRATTTFGIRSYPVTREILERHFATVATRFGPVRLKIGRRQGEDLVRSPEFEDCARLARAHDTTPRQVYTAALQGKPVKKATRQAPRP
jgi:uncharacterized protein (TIGR00299 family) protein